MKCMKLAFTIFMVHVWSLSCTPIYCSNKSDDSSSPSSVKNEVRVEVGQTIFSSSNIAKYAVYASPLVLMYYAKNIAHMVTYPLPHHVLTEILIRKPLTWGIRAAVVYGTYRYIMGFATKRDLENMVQEIEKEIKALKKEAEECIKTDCKEVHNILDTVNKAVDNSDIQIALAEILCGAQKLQACIDPEKNDNSNRSLVIFERELAAIKQALKKSSSDDETKKIRERLEALLVKCKAVDSKRS